MEFTIVTITSQKFESRVKIAYDLSDEIGSLFKDKSFSSLIKELFVGIVCVSAKSLSFYEVRQKPRLSRKNYSLEYSVLFDEDKILSLSNLEIKKIFISELINTSNKIKSKVKDFDIDGYTDILKGIIG